MTDNPWIDREEEVILVSEKEIRMSAVAAHRLSQLLAPIIGRDDDLNAIQGYLQQQRLVTLWGPGGSGKTRLAMQIVQQLAGDFADGARFVDCADLYTAEVLIRQVAATCSLQAPEEQASLDNLIEWLRSRQLLLVLDNCEHLLEACTPLVEQILAFCPQVHILMTSRELLNLLAEQAYPVRPLALPPLDRFPSTRSFHQSVSSGPYILSDTYQSAAPNGVCLGRRCAPGTSEMVPEKAHDTDEYTAPRHDNSAGDGCRWE